MAALVRQVRPVLERHGTPAQRSDFFGNLLFMASRRDRYVISDETLGYGRARLAAAEEMGEPFQVATAQFNLGFSLLFYGNLDEAVRCFLQSLGFAERAGDVTRVRILGGPSTGAACGGDLRLTWSPRSVVPQQHRARIRDAPAGGSCP
jgi:hypothetical protein